MKVGIKLGKVKKFRIGWCIPHRMAADNAEGRSGQTPASNRVNLLRKRTQRLKRNAVKEFQIQFKIH